MCKMCLSYFLHFLSDAVSVIFTYVSSPHIICAKNWHAVCLWSLIFLAIEASASQTINWNAGGFGHWFFLMSKAAASQKIWPGCWLLVSMFLFYTRSTSSSDILVKSRALYRSRRPASGFFFICCIARLIWTVSAPEPTMMVYLLLLTLDRYGLNALGPTFLYNCQCCSLFLDIWHCKPSYSRIYFKLLEYDKYWILSAPNQQAI